MKGLTVQFTGRYDFLDLKYKTDVTIGNLTFKSAYAAYMALRVSDRRYMPQFCDATCDQADALIARYGLDAGEDNESIMSALQRVNLRKFENPRLKLRLSRIHEDIVYESDDTLLGQKDGKGINLLGSILMSVRDGEIDPMDDDEVMPKPILGPIHPGHIRNMKGDKSRVLIKMPWPELEGTVSIIAPAEDVTFTDKKVTKGRYADKPYLCLSLNRHVYVTVFHDKEGHVVTGIIPETLTDTQLVDLYHKNTKKLMEKMRDRRSPQTNKKPSTIIIHSPVASDLFEGVNIIREPQKIQVSLSNYPDQVMFLKIDLTNTVTGTSKTITCPPVTDSPHRIDNYMLSIDLTLYQKETEFLTALGVIEPALESLEKPDSNTVVDKAGAYAMSMFYLNPKAASKIDPAFQSYYEQNVLTHVRDVIAADPDFRTKRQQGRSTMTDTIHDAMSRIVHIYMLGKNDQTKALAAMRR